MSVIKLRVLRRADYPELSRWVFSEITIIFIRGRQREA